MYLLYLGATRLPTYLGIPRKVFIGTLMFCAVLWLQFHLWAVAVAVFLLFVEWMISKHDDRMFRIIGLFFRTKLINAFRSWVGYMRFKKAGGIAPGERWGGGNSYSPTDNAREDIV